MHKRPGNPAPSVSFVRFGSPVRFAWLAIALLAAAVLPVRADDPADAKSADSQEWTDILPSSDLTGWYRVSVPPGKPLGRAQWHVNEEHRLLICDGDGGHDMLLTEKEYGDVVFQFEFRYTKIEGKEGYNSGAYVRNSKDGAIWHQAQFGDAKDGFLFGMTTTTGGKKTFFNLNKKVSSNRVKPAGQWNLIEMTALGKTLTLRVNGEVTCEYDDCGVEKGHLGFEGEGYRIEFRNVRVRQP